jgi:hypothetical protein
MWGALSDDKIGLPFTIAAGHRQRSSFSGQSPAGLMAIFFYCIRSETPPIWWARSRIYIPQGGTVTPQNTSSVYVASNDSQGYGGGIGARLHAGTF